MKKIASIIIAMFMGIALMVSGGVLLSGCGGENSDIEIKNEVQTSATIPTRNFFSINANGGVLQRTRSYQIGDISLTNYGYGFSVNSNGYFESQNKGVHDSFSMIRIRFSANDSTGNNFTIRYICYAEANYDYAIFGNIDSELSQSVMLDSSFYFTTYGQSSSSVRELTYYNISKGTHYIYIKYRKDYSNSSYKDSLQIFFETDQLTSSSAKYQFQGLMYGTLPNATRSGYVFDGWWTASSGGTRITESSIYNGQAIYAHWTSGETFYWLQYNANGGNINLLGQLPNMGSSSSKIESSGTGMYYYIANNEIFISSYPNDYHDHYGHLNIWVYLTANVNHCLRFKAVSTNSSVLDSGVDAGFFPNGGYDSSYYFIGGPTVNSTTVPVEFVYNFTPATSGSYQLRLDSNLNNASFRLYDFSLVPDNGSGGRMHLYNTQYAAMATATKEGYEFAGWHTSSSSGTLITNGTTVSSDKTVYAHWMPKSFTLNFNPNGGSVNLLDNLSPIGTSSNWISNATVNYYISGNTIYIKSDSSDTDDHYGYLDIWANLKAGVSYTLQFDAFLADNSSASSSVQAGFFPENGYSDGDGRYYHGGGVDVYSTTSATAFYLNFTPIETGIYRLRIDTNANNASFKINNFKLLQHSGSFSYSYTFNSSIRKLPTAIRTGYTLDGWWTSANGGTQVTTTTKNISNGQNLYAHWTANTYTVAFDANGGSVSSSSKPVTYKSTYGALPTPTRTFYNFVSWRLNLGSAANFVENSAVSASTGEFLPYYSGGYWSHPNLIDFVNTSGADVEIKTNYAIDGLYAYDINKNFIKRCAILTSSFMVPSGTYYIRFEMNPTFLSYSNRHLFTAVCNSKAIDSTSIVNVPQNHTLMADWTPAPVSINVKLRVINMDGTYSDVDNANGGEVEVHWWEISGASSSPVGAVQTDSSRTYSTHAGQQLYLVAHEKSGYHFVGISTSSSPSDAIKTPNSSPSTTVYFYPSSNTTYYVYFKQMSGNQLKYDKTNKYFYFEDGYYPQSEANEKLITYDKSTEYLRLDGKPTQSVTIVKSVDCTFKEGEYFKLSFEYVSGSINNGVNVAICADLMAPGEVTLTTLWASTLSPSYTETCKIDATGAANATYVRLRLYWNGEDISFSNALFAVTIEKDKNSELNDMASSTGESFTYSDGRKDASIPVYSYNGERFVKVTKAGTSAWFKFEPIRWRISDYGVEKTELNIARYTSLYNLRNYTSYASNFTAVSDLILGVGAMHNTRVIDENRKTETGALDGTYSIHMVGFQNVENTTNGCSLNFNYSANQSMIDVERYGHSETGDGNAVFNSADNGWYHPYSSPLRIASIKELDEVGFVNKQARASDMVAFILGLDKDQVSYWTRDLSNLGAGVAITPTGTEIRPWLDEVLGMRFAYTFREGSNAF